MTVQNTADRICVVTGATSGVGRATACGLARAGATVVLLSRRLGNAKRAAQEFSRLTGNKALYPYCCDLGDFDSIRECANRIIGDFKSIHVLSNNAAVMPMRRQSLPNGIESIFGINYLGHFLLTNLLLDPLKRGAPSRILTVSGNPFVFRFGRLPLDDLIDPRIYNPFTATYRAAKAKVLFSFALASRLKGTQVTSNTFHPGLIRTGLTRQMPFLLKWAADLGQRFFSDTCDPCTYLALSPDVQEFSGTFFNKRRAIRFKPYYDLFSESRTLWDKSLEWTSLVP